MKSLWKFLLCSLLLLSAGMLTGCGGASAEPEETAPAETTPPAYLDPNDHDTILRVSTGTKLRTIDNKISNMNMWNYNMF